MKPTKDGSNVTLHAHCDMEGQCSDLPVLLTGEQGDNPMMQSLWLPSLEELKLLKSGHAVLLTIWGRQHPPVELGLSERAVEKR